ncbi:MAG: MFS transporter [Microbacteriaceae bacterium]
MSGMFRSMTQINFRIWFVGAFVSNVGGWMQSTAQSWVVLTELTNFDATAVGLTMALQFGPPLLLAGPTGWVADRFNRRITLIITQTLQGLLALALGVLLLSGHANIWQMYVFALVFGIVNAFDMSSRQAFVNDLVGKQHISNAVALNAASFNAARLVGPAVAGLLLAVTSSGWVFLINAATFVAVIAALMMLRTSELNVVDRPSKRVSMSEGFGYVRKRSDIIVVLILVFLVGAFGMNFPIFSSTMAVAFGRGAETFGVLSSVLAVGSLTGALLTARRERARLGVVVAAAAGVGLASLGLALAPTVELFAIISVLMGFSVVTMMTTANGYVQTTSEPRIRGRVVAIYVALMVGATPIGAPIVGWVAQAAGPRWALGVSAVAGIIAALIGLGWLIVARGLAVHRHPVKRWALTVSTNPGHGLPVAPVTSPVSVVTENITEPSLDPDER